MGRMEQSGIWDRHLKEWSLEPSLRQPAISLEARPARPARRPPPGRCRPSPTAATRPAVFWEGVVVSSEIPKLPETWFGLKVK